MSKRKFSVYFTGRIKIKLDDQVIDVVDDEWRSCLHDLKTPEEIAVSIMAEIIKVRRAREHTVKTWEV